MRTEAELRVVAEKLAKEKLQRSFQVRDGNSLVHIKPLHLRELREVRRINFVTAIRSTRRDDAHGRGCFFHRANLHGARVRAQQTAIGEIESILLVARGVVGGRVQRVEAMPLGLDVRPVGERETHPAENCRRAIQKLRNRMQRSFSSKRSRSARQRHIHAGERSLVRIREQRGFACIERGGDDVAHIIEQFADARFVLFGKILHPLAERRESALLAEKFHTREIERGFIGGGCNCGDGFVAELVKLCVHVKKRALSLPQGTGKGTKSFCCSE